jgi:hypothetical protein
MGQIERVAINILSSLFIAPNPATSCAPTLWARRWTNFSMKTILTSLLLLTVCTTVTCGQNSKYDFAKDVFRREYKKKDYGKFSGQVEVINKNTFRYGDKVFNRLYRGRKANPDFLKGYFPCGHNWRKKHYEIIDKIPVGHNVNRCQSFLQYIT